MSEKPKNHDNGQFVKLTEQQHGLFIEYTFNPTSTQYNTSLGFELIGNLDKRRFFKAVEKTLETIPTFKITKFFEKNDEPYQIFDKNAVNKCRFINLMKEKNVSKVSRDEAIKVIEKETKKHCDIFKGPVYQTLLVQYENKKYFFIISAQHITSDGKTAIMSMKVIAFFYNHRLISKFMKGKVQFHTIQDYLNYRKKNYTKKMEKDDIDYWKKRLRGSNMHLDFRLPNRKEIKNKLEGKRIYFEIKDEKILSLVKKTESTLFVVLFCLYRSFLFRIFNQEDFCISYACDIRPKEMKYIAGFFVNQMLLRSVMDRKMSLMDLIKIVSEQRLEDRKRKDLSFSKLLDELRKETPSLRSKSVNVSFGQSMFSVENVSLSKMKTKFFIAQDYGEVIYDLSMLYQHLKKEKKIKFSMEYRRCIFDDEFIKNLTKHFKFFVGKLLKHLNDPISKIKIVPESDFKRQVIDFNNTKKKYPDTTFQELFERDLNSAGERVAVECRKRELKYKDLNALSNKVGHYLRNKFKIKPNQFVGICLERSSDLVMFMLGVLKSGGVYFPIDNKLPADRLKFMLEETECKVVFTNQKFKKKFEKFSSVNPVVIDENDVINEIMKEREINPKIVNTSKDICYVIYTSGSTGKPKGGLVEHGNLLHFYYHVKKYLWGKNIERCAFSHNIAFDVSILDLLPTLLSKKTMVVIPEEIHTDGEKLHAYFDEKKINFSFFVTSILKLYPRKPLPHLKTILVGGEKCDYDDMRYWSSHIDNVYVGYGPSETTVLSSTKLFTEKELETNLGKPHENYYYYILDSNLQLVPVGVPGELCIGGLGVGRGYLKRPELTKKKYIVNPFDPSDRLFRSGDLCKFDPNGDAIFICRVDFQVKIRGLRIELGEIENSIKSTHLVEDAIVLAVKTNNIARLVAYICKKDVKDADDVIKDKIKSFLLKKLPDYMVPSNFVFLDKFPLNISGKTDRKKLMSIKITHQKYVAPRNDVEKKICKIWSEMLGVKKVGINDDFFEIGGNSLVIISLVKKINKMFATNVPPGYIYESPNVYSLANFIKQHSNLGYYKMEKMKRPKLVPLSYTQDGLYFVTKNSNNGMYNIALNFEINDVIKEKFFKLALQRVVDKHECLRTTFLMDKTGKPYQKINKVLHPEFSFVDFSRVSLKVISMSESEERDEEKYLIGETNKPFDIEKGPLLRVFLIKKDKNRFILSIVLHHIIFDRWSMFVFFKDLFYFYDLLIKGKSISFKPMEFQYADFAVWQKGILRNKIHDVQMKYWKDVFKDAPHPLNLTTDFKIKKERTYEGKTVRFELSKELNERIIAFSKRYEVGVYSMFLSVFEKLLLVYSGQKDIIVGIPTTNRHYSGCEEIIGYFTNTLPLRIYVDRPCTFLEMIKQIEKKYSGLNENQDIHFTEIVEELKIMSDRNNPGFQVSFAFFHSGDSLKNTEVFNRRVSVLSENYSQFSRFDVTLYVNFTEEGKTTLDFEYSTELFKDQSIIDMFNRYIHICDQMIINCKQKFQDISLLTSKEYNRIVLRWNNTKTDYRATKYKSINEVIEKGVKANPTKIAAEFFDEKITYSKLNEKANQFAHYLRRNFSVHITRWDSHSERYVGVCVKKSIDLIVLILGVVKSGAVYFPIDPKLPKERLKFMFEDTRCQVVITESEFAEKFDFVKGTVIVLEKGKLDFEKEKSSNPKNLCSYSNLAYIIYTSGSTGKPKGVLIEHRNLLNYFSVMKNEIFSLDKSCTRMGFLSNIVFDASIHEVFVSLLHSFTIVIVPDDYRTDGEKLYEYFNKKKVHTTIFVPSILKMLPRKKLPHLKVMMVGGEQCDYETLLFWSKQVKVLYNCYGPTECTIMGSFKRFTEREYPTNIGKPMKNYTYYLLSKSLQPVPIGIPGELFIGGAGVSRGYLNRRQTNLKHFIKSPFKENEILFRTGDLCKYLPNGDVFFIGRVDFQVKIRGLRIELGDIESAIRSFKNVKDTVVLIKKDERENKRLIAFVVLKKKIDDEDDVTERIRKHLSEKLVYYMIPNNFVFLDKFPLNYNGKVDKKQLIMPKTLYIPPSNEIERRTCHIWSDVLQVDKIGVKDNFFDLGGSSLNVFRLINQIENFFSIKVTTQDIFNHPTIAELCKRIENYRTKGESKRDILINFHKVDFSVPLILFHNGNGLTGLQYKSLAPIIENFSVYCIDNPRFGCSDGKAYKSVEEMAKEYTDILVKTGYDEFFLGGHCFGGVLAIEIAYLLEKRGKKVDCVIMINSFNNFEIFKTIKKVYSEKTEISKKMVNVFEEGSIEIRKIDLKSEIGKKIKQELKNIGKIALKYKPKPTIKTKVKLLQTSEGSKEIEKQLSSVIDDFSKLQFPKNGWSKVFKNGKFDVTKIKGTHLTIFEHGNVEVCGREINKILKRVKMGKSDSCVESLMNKSKE